MKKRSEKRILVQYCVVQGGYCAGSCALYGFATMFLISRGFTLTQIGVLIALGNIIGIILQPVLAGIADASQKITVHGLIRCILAVIIVLLAVLLVVPRPFAGTAVLYVAADALLWSLQPLINSISVYYINKGMNIDFGKGRGVGSLCYALSSATIGRLAGRFGANIILITAMVVLTVSFFMILLLPVLAEDSQKKDRTYQNRYAALNKKEKNTLLFFCRYRNFTLILAGIILLHIFHNSINNYLMQMVEAVGGSSAQQGIAMTIAAMTEFPMMFLFFQMHKRFGTAKIIKFAAVVYVLRACICFGTGSIEQLYLQQFLQIGTYALMIPAGVYLANETMEEEDKYKGQAMVSSTEAIGGVLGSLAGGFLIDHAGLKAMLFVGILLSVAGAGIIVRVLGLKKEKEI